MSHKLTITTVSKTGKWSKRRAVGAVYLDAFNPNSNVQNQFAIEVTHSTGVKSFKTTTEHETELINITFMNGVCWTGDFLTLQSLLTK